MRYTKAGEKSVSKIAFGGAVIYNSDLHSYYFDALDLYLSKGGNFIDTALCYGAKQSWGPSLSQITIGEWIKERGNRDKVVISTKGAHPPFGDMHNGRVTPEFIRSDLNTSLNELGVSNIDVYFLHRDDESKPVGPIMDELNRAYDSGKISVLGASNWKGERIYRANDYAEKHGMQPFKFNQINFSLAFITPEARGDDTLVCMNDEEYRFCRELGLTVMAYTSQAKGFFTKFIDTPDSEITGSFAIPENIAKLARVRDICSQRKITPAQCALAYLTSLDVDTIPIIGFSRLEQLEDSMGAGDVILSQDEVAYLENGK